MQNFDNRNGTEDKILICHDGGPTLITAPVAIGQYCTTPHGNIVELTPTVPGYKERSCAITYLWANLGTSDIPQPANAFYNANKVEFALYLEDDGITLEVLFEDAGAPWVLEHITNNSDLYG